MALTWSPLDGRWSERWRWRGEAGSEEPIYAGPLFSCLAWWLPSCHEESEVAWVRGGDASDGDEGGVR